MPDTPPPSAPPATPGATSTDSFSLSGMIDSIGDFFKKLSGQSPTDAASPDAASTNPLSKAVDGIGKLFEWLLDSIVGAFKKIWGWLTSLFHSDAPSSQQGMPQNPGQGCARHPGPFQAQSYPSPMIGVDVIPMGIPVYHCHGYEGEGAFHGGHCGHGHGGGGRGGRR